MENVPFRIVQTLEPQSQMLDIQRARWALEKFENKFNENPSFVASGTVMKQLLDIYKECKSIDEVMGTRHFDEEHFDGLRFCKIYFLLHFVASPTPFPERFHGC